MINVKKSQKNKTLHLKNLKTLKTPHPKPNPYKFPHPHTRLRASTKLLQHQKYKKLKAQQIAKPYATLNPPNV